MENPRAFSYHYNLNVLNNTIKVNNTTKEKQQKQQIFKINKYDFLKKKREPTIIDIIDKTDDTDIIKKNWTEEEVKFINLIIFKNKFINIGPKTNNSSN
jgi:hypothetical protein